MTGGATVARIRYRFSSAVDGYRYRQALVLNDTDVAIMLGIGNTIPYAALRHRRLPEPVGCAWIAGLPVVVRCGTVPVVANRTAQLTAR
jgi:hypothetical protein